MKHATIEYVEIEEEKMKRLLITLILVTFLLSGCGSASPMMADEAYVESNTSAPSNAGGWAEAQSAPEITYGDEPAPEPSADMDDSSKNGHFEASSVERMVIYNANIEITVRDPQITNDNIKDMAEEYNGFVVNSNLSKVSNYIDGYGYYYLAEAYLQIRVPADKLDDAMHFIREQVDDKDLDIANENISGQDVTKEYTDLSAQLISLEAYKETLLNYLETTQNNEEALEVFREIQTADTNIERIKGEMKYYEESSAYSSIAVTIHQSDDEMEQIRQELKQKIDEKGLGKFNINDWQPVKIAKQAAESLVNVLMGIGSVLIYLIVLILPVLIVIVAPIYLIIRFFSKRKKNNKGKEKKVSDDIKEV
jgi:flagellar basal body-associated protein FliL